MARDKVIVYNGSDGFCRVVIPSEQCVLSDEDIIAVLTFNPHPVKVLKPDIWKKNLIKFRTKFRLLKNLGVEVTDNSHIKVDQHGKTNVDNIYAVGDVIGPPWLAHVATAEGLYVAELLCDLTAAPFLPSVLGLTGLYILTPLLLFPP